MENPRKPGERTILDRICEGLGSISPDQRRTSLRVGIGDDAALWRPRAGYEAILTCDWFLQGTHFLADRHPPEAVGYKCLARAVSDIAAMGGEPRCYLLSLALPDNRTGEWLRKFLKGLRKASRILGCPIAGDPIYGGSYDYFKAQLSAVYALTPTWSVQGGAVTTYAGRNALQENGGVFGVWYRF